MLGGSEAISLTTALESPLEIGILESLDIDSICCSILRLSGFSYIEPTKFKDAFDVWTQERIFAVHVLVLALSDIAPLDPEPPPAIFGSPKRLTDWVSRHDCIRQTKILDQQIIEEELRLEGINLLSKYRREYKAFIRSFDLRHYPIKRYKINNIQTKKQTVKYRKLRYKYDQLVCQLNLKKSEKDLHNTAIDWFTSELPSVEMWCHLASIDILRCYEGVQRRIQTVNRSSIKIQAIIKELRKPKKIMERPRIHSNEILFSINNHRRDKAIKLFEQFPRDDIEIKSPVDRYFVKNIEHIILSNGIIGQRQLIKLETILAKTR